MKYLAILLLGLSGLAHANTPDPHVPELKQASLKSGLSYQILESLTVEVGPRIAGSEGDKRAVAWAEAKFNALGYDKVYKEPVRVRNWSRGAAKAQITSPFPQTLSITALGGSVATPEGGLTAEVVYFDSLESLSASSKSQVEGKIVFIDKKMFRDKAGRAYGQVVGGRSKGAVEAAKLGAKAIIIRSVGTDNSRFAHTGAMRYSKDVAKIPAAAMSNADADLLTSMFKKGKPITLAMQMQAKEHGWQTSYNVIGEITGSEKPQEIVLIAAHLDSWDEGTGALDDGAGVGIVMAAASHIKKIVGQPRRTVRVVLYANEEFGLVGAREYTRKHKNELDNIIVAAESDFGAGRIWRFDTRFANAQQGDFIYKELKGLGIERGSNTARGGPDISMLPKYGVPVVTLLQDGTYYFDYHHTANDTLDKVDPDALAQNTAAYTLFAYLVANSEVNFREKSTSLD